MSDLMKKGQIFASGAIAIIFLLAIVPCRAASEPSLVWHQSFDQGGEVCGQPLYGGIEVNRVLGLSGLALDVVVGHGALVCRESPPDLEDEFTVRLVIYPRKINGFRTILFKGDRACSPEKINYAIDIRDGKFEFKTKDANGDWAVFNTSAVVEPERWLLVQFSFRNGKAKLWLNGEDTPLNNNEPGKIGKGLLTNNSPLYIGIGLGHNGGAPSFAFDGLIDEIKIYKKALKNCDAEEIREFRKRAYGYAEKAELYRLKQRAAEFAGRLRSIAVPEVSDVNKWKMNRYRLGRELELQKSEDAASYQERIEKIEPEVTAFIQEALFYTLCPKGNKFGVLAMSDAERLVKKTFFHDGLKNATTKVTLDAARNEREGFQAVILAPPGDGVKSVSVEVGDLVKEGGAVRIAGAEIKWGWIRDIVSEQPDIAVDFVGPIPDAIMEDGSAFGVAGGSFMPVHFRIRVPAGAEPGKYSGQVIFTCDRESKALPVEITVHSFVLPQRCSFRTALAFFEKYYCQWYGLKEMTDEQKRAVYDFLLQYRIAPCNIYGGKDTFPERKFLDEYRGRTNFFTYALRYIKSPVPQDELDQMVKDAQATYEWVRNSGQAENGYVYLYDELIGHPESMPGAKQLMPALHRALPGAKFMQTSFPEPEIRDMFNVWCPVFSYFGDASHLAKLKKLKKQGCEIWWYSADDPAKPYPNFFLDYPVFDCRIIMTLSHMYKVDGILYWCINREWATNADAGKRWPEGEWKPWIFYARRGTRKYKNGMGNFLYPGPNGKLLPSIRLENLRDGLEDYEYMVLLEKAIKRLSAEKTKENKDLLVAAQEAVKVPAAVARAVNDYSSDPHKLFAWRKRMAEVLDKLVEAGVIK